MCRPAVSFLWWSLAVVLLLAETALAVPADRAWRTFLQPDKTVFIGRENGDDFLVWYETKGGIVFLYNPKSGGYEYAVRKKGRGGLPCLRPSGILVTDPPGRLKPIRERVAREIRELRRAVSEASVPLIEPGEAWFYRPKAVFPLLLVQVDFADTPSTLSAEWWSEKFFSSGEDSVNTYYREVSRGRARFEPCGEFEGVADDGIVRVVLDGVHPFPGDDREAAQAVVVDALDKADEYVDFSLLDEDDDGNLSSDELQLVVVFAGPLGDDRRLGVWPHAWWFGHSPPIHDGVTMSFADAGGTYAVLPEFQGGRPQPLGTIAHELGHSAFHLPDLYDVQDEIGDWGLMGTGANGHLPGEHRGTKPTHMIAACKIWAGFVEPTEFLPTPDVDTVDLYHHFEWSYRPVVIPTQISAADYIVLEHRRVEGFDEGLTGDFGLEPGDSGILATFVSGSVVHLLRASGRRDFGPRSWDLFRAEMFGRLAPDADPGTRHPLFGFRTGIDVAVEENPPQDGYRTVSILLGPRDRDPLPGTAPPSIEPPTAEVAGDSVMISGFATDEDDDLLRVDVRLGDGPWRATQVAPAGPDHRHLYLVTIDDLDPGTYTLQIRAFDAQGRAAFLDGERVAEITIDG